MRERIANKLLEIALWIYPMAHPEIKKLAIGYKIERDDVKKYQKAHPKCGSWLKAQEALIEESVKQAEMSIALGLRKNNLIKIEKKRGLTRTEVVASLNVYAPKATTE